MSSPETLNVLLFDVGVNMGDHAETVIRAQQVDPNETVGDLARRLLTRERNHYDYETKTTIADEPEVLADNRIEIRLALAPEKDGK